MYLNEVFQWYRGKKKETSLDKSIISFLESGFAISRKLSSRGDRLLEKKKIKISKFQFDREFEGHGFVSRMTVMCYPRKNKVDLFIYSFFLAFYIR